MAGDSQTAKENELSLFLKYIFTWMSAHVHEDTTD